jgi:hypothetical protein
MLIVLPIKLVSNGITVFAMNLPSNFTGAAKVPARSVRRRMVNEAFMLVSGGG